MAKTKTVNPEAEQAASTPAPERKFVIGEAAVQALFQYFQELPHKFAKPLDQFLQQNLQEVKAEDVTEA